MRQPSTTGGQHSFARVPRAEIPRSVFDRSYGHKTTISMGSLVPVYVDEALPGDTFSMRMSAFGRFATLLKPLMDNVYLDTFFFAVPYRLVWENWEKFCGAQDDPGDSTDFTVPQFVAHTVLEGQRSDYFGIPTGVAGIVYNSLHHRAYNLIWNEWFRDENLQTSVVIPLGDGPDPYDFSAAAVWSRGKRHDYFTSCLPFPQKGVAVTLPLGVSAPVESAFPGLAKPLFAGGSIAGSPLKTGLAGSSAGVSIDNTGGVAADLIWDDPQLIADLSGATAATINDLREAFQIQKLLERDARGGTRYPESIRAHFGVESPDARLQRPEYLGGGTSFVAVAPVAQSTASPAVPTSLDAQANLAGMGTVAVHGHSWSKSFTEHCLLIGLVCVRADLSYQQGMSRMWSRQTRLDYYWPALAHLGEQAVLNKEIFTQGLPVDDDVFGYQERYAEYRYYPSLVTGVFRSNAITPLDIWHLAQDFGELPTLGEDFIFEQPPIERVIAVPSEPAILLDAYFKLKCARPMPVFGVPGLIDHF